MRRQPPLRRRFSGWSSVQPTRPRGFPTAGSTPPHSFRRIPLDAFPSIRTALPRCLKVQPHPEVAAGVFFPVCARPCFGGRREASSLPKACAVVEASPPKPRLEFASSSGRRIPPWPSHAGFQGTNVPAPRSLVLRWKSLDAAVNGGCPGRAYARLVMGPCVFLSKNSLLGCALNGRGFRRPRGCLHRRKATWLRGRTWQAIFRPPARIDRSCCRTCRGSRGGNRSR
jgi:hypothetical protein